MKLVKIGDTNAVLLTFEFQIYILKTIKRTLVAVAGKKHRSTTSLLSPNRLAEIQSRKRVIYKSNFVNLFDIQF